MNPSTVAFAPPVAVMVPFNVAVMELMLEAALVVTVGAHGLVVNVASEPVAVPEEFVANA